MILEGDCITVEFRGKKRVIADNKESLNSLHKEGLIYLDGKKTFVLCSDAIWNRISELERWKTMYQDEKQKTRELEVKLRKLELEAKSIKPEKEDIETSSGLSDRDALGRFAHGHKVAQQRDSKGRFIKRVNETSISN